MKTYEQLETVLSRALILLIMSWVITLSVVIKSISVLNKNEVLQKGVANLSATVDMDTVDMVSLQERIAELETANEELIKLSGVRK